MIYNNHVAYKVDLKPDAFADLASEPNLVAVKESSHDSRRITDMINLLGDRYRIVCGVDDLMLENVLFGAVGWVSGLANAFPREAVELFRLAEAGRTDEALALYRWFMPLLHLDVATKLVQYIKLVNQLTGEGREWVRAPRLTLVGEERARIEALVATALANRPQSRPGRLSDICRANRRRHRRRRHHRHLRRLQAAGGRPERRSARPQGHCRGNQPRQCRRLRLLRHHPAGDLRRPRQAAALAQRSARSADHKAGVSATDHALAAALLARRLARPSRRRHQGAERNDAHRPARSREPCRQCRPRCHDPLRRHPRTL